VTTFADIPEQAEAKRLLEAALADGPAHAYLFHGPAGVGKRPAARALAGALLGDPRRVDGRTHPDLHVTEALGAMIRIDEIRALHHDLHLRPFEADRRVYLILDADRMNDEAAAALLKDLEEPPAYATIVLVADELGKLPTRSAPAASSSPSGDCLAPPSRSGWRPGPPISTRRRSPWSPGWRGAGSTVPRASWTTTRAPDATRCSTRHAAPTRRSPSTLPRPRS
jgi:hypothetical protein